MIVKKSWFFVRKKNSLIGYYILMLFYKPVKASENIQGFKEVLVLGLLMIPAGITSCINKRSAIIPV